MSCVWVMASDKQHATLSHQCLWVCKCDSQVRITVRRNKQETFACNESVDAACRTSLPGSWECVKRTSITLRLQLLYHGLLRTSWRSIPDGRRFNAWAWSPSVFQRFKDVEDFICHVSLRGSEMLLWQNATWLCMKEVKKSGQRTLKSGKWQLNMLFTNTQKYNLKRQYSYATE